MDKIWLKNYPKNVKEQIEYTENDLYSWLEKSALKYSDRKAFTCDNESINFKQFQSYVNNLAASLQNLGINKGDRVAVILPNLIQYPISIFAILKLAAIVVNINPLYTTNEIDYILENSGAKAIIVLDMMAGKLDTLYNKYNVQHVIVTKLPDVYPFYKQIIFNFTIKNIKKINVKYNYKAEDFKKLINTVPVNFKCDKISSDDIAFIQYTGATTGKPKGAVLTHRNIVSNLLQVYEWLNSQFDLSKTYVVIDALPLYHIFSLTANLFTFMFCGSENVMVANPRDVKSLVKAMKKSNFSVFSALDTLLSLLLHSKEFTKEHFPNYKYGIAGGMSLRSSVTNKWKEVTGVNLSNCYGLTETSPALTMNKFGDEPFDGSVGFPISSTEIEIRDLETSKELPITERGVIWVRGPQVMKEYWNNPEQTSLVFDKDGWFNTKDLGYINTEGKLFISGRFSELIIVSGFNVYCAEVESVLNGIEEILNSAIVGVPSDKTGEAVVAFILFRNGKFLTNEQIIIKCKEKITPYKIPKIIYVVDELPRTLVGKIDKKILLKIALEKNN